MFHGCQHKLFENEYSILLHVFRFHKGSWMNPQEILKKSKGCFEVPMGETEIDSGLEDNPKIVGLSPELQLIIDYKVSLVDLDVFMNFKPKVPLSDEEKANTTQNRHVSQLCGNLSDLQQVKRIFKNAGSQASVPKHPNPSETRLTIESKAKPTVRISNLQVYQPVSDSDDDQVSLLGKRDNEVRSSDAQKKSLDGQETDKRVKKEVVKSANKRAPQRVANL